jgi:hypothetical protein
MEREATMRTILCALISLLTLTVLSAGCGEEGAESAGPTPEPATQPPTPTATATTPAETSPPPQPPAQKACAPTVGGEGGIYTNLVAVRIGTHEDYDRITFEFRAPEPNPGGKGGVPRYEIRTAKPPHYEDASGRPLEVNGKVFARIVFHGAAGYDFDGQPTYNGPRTIRAGFDVLTEAVEAGDFEATLSWVLGFRQQACWDVREFHNPDRVAIDIPHDVVK